MLKARTVKRSFKFFFQCKPKLHLHHIENRQTNFNEPKFPYYACLILTSGKLSNDLWFRTLYSHQKEKTSWGGVETEFKLRICAGFVAFSSHKDSKAKVKCAGFVAFSSHKDSKAKVKCVEFVTCHVPLAGLELAPVYCTVHFRLAHSFPPSGPLPCSHNNNIREPESRAQGRS